MLNFETILSFLLGISLAAAVGFRIFIPLLVLSLASMSGSLTLSSGFEWIGTLPAFIVFLTASLFELGAYFIPFVDNLLDTIASPAAVIAGSIVVASSIVEMEPLLKWTLAIVAGGGAAGIVQSVTAITRGASTVTTGGLGNPMISATETTASISLSVLAIFFPLFMGVIVLLFLGWASKKIASKFTKKKISLK